MTRSLLDTNMVGLAGELRPVGRPMQQIDIMIAAVALSLGNCMVVRDDSEACADERLFLQRSGIRPVSVSQPQRAPRLLSPPCEGGSGGVVSA